MMKVWWELRVLTFRARECRTRELGPAARFSSHPRLPDGPQHKNMLMELLGKATAAIGNVQAISFRNAPDSVIIM
jgi:hypothetical protein